MNEPLNKKPYYLVDSTFQCIEEVTLKDTYFDKLRGIVSDKVSEIERLVLRELSANVGYAQEEITAEYQGDYIRYYADNNLLLTYFQRLVTVHEELNIEYLITNHITGEIITLEGVDQWLIKKF